MLKKLIVTTSALLAISAYAENCTEIRAQCASVDDPNMRFVQVSQIDCACLTKGSDGNIAFPDNMPTGVRDLYTQAYNNNGTVPAAQPTVTQLTSDQNTRLREFQGTVARCDSPNVRLASESVSDCTNRLIRAKCEGNPNEDTDMCVGKYQQSLSAANAANIPVQVNGRNVNEILAQGGNTTGRTAGNTESQTDTSGNGSAANGVKLNAPLSFPPVSALPLRMSKSSKTYSQHKLSFPPVSALPLRMSKSSKTYSQHKANPAAFGDAHGFSASGALQLCEGEAAKPWPQLISQSTSNNWGVSMDEFVGSTIKAFNEKFKEKKPKSEYEQFMKEVRTEIASRITTYTQCQALTTLMVNSDFNDTDVESGNDKGKYVKVSVTKPELKCETSYHDSQDFYGCVKVLNAYDALDIAGKGMQVYQQVDNGMKLSDRQMDLQKKTLTGGTIDTTDVLQQQKQTVKDAAGYAQQRAALDTAKVATLYAMLNQMPSKESLLSNCNGEQIVREVKNMFDERIGTLQTAFDNAQFDAEFSEFKSTYAANLITSSSPTATTTADSSQPQVDQSRLCSNAFISSRSGSRGGVQLLSNQAIKQQMKGEMVKAGVDAASNMAKAALLNKQAGEIDDVINSIKSFEPPPLPEQQLTDMQILECQANPQAENCGTINGRGNVSFTGNGINVGNGQFATTDGQGIDLGNTDPTASNSATSKTDRTGMARKLGGATADAPGDGGILNPVAAAEIKKGGGNPGGGGGAAGASAPGAAGGSGGKPGAGGGSSAASGQGLAKMKYSGSSSGSLSWSGGGGLARKPAAKVDNPFANLLGKGGGKNGVLDGFRGPASGIGKKEDGLFNMISNRYSQVANDKERLIQYEIKK